MKTKRRAHRSRNWKICTPERIVSIFWRTTLKHRRSLGRILDMGAGDGRFAQGGKYKEYVGIEIDQRANASWTPSRKKTYVHGCVFEHAGNSYSACIGNPPYLRHNEISVRWRDKIVSRFQDQLGLNLDARSNLYLYFMSLALQKTSPDGIVSVLVPYDWSFIPSANPIRRYIEANGWGVYIYRFTYSVFENAMTTASVSIIDKSDSSGVWNFFDIDSGGKIVEAPHFTDDGEPPLAYEERGRIWAMRGLSPGNQKVFTLSESQRIASELTKRDVRPCVTSLRHVPSGLKLLDTLSFNKYFVSKDKKCWLIRTDKRLTESLRRYLAKIPTAKRNTWTCLNRTRWYRYGAHPTPKLLMSSAFKGCSPRILSNGVKATAVGAVFGIHSKKGAWLKATQNKLMKFDFSSRIVSREKGLKKIAVKQVNAALNLLDNESDGS